MKSNLFYRRNRGLVVIGVVTIFSTFALFIFMLGNEFFDTHVISRDRRDGIYLSPSNQACPAILLCENNTARFECTNDAPCQSKDQVCCLCFDGQKTRCSVKASNATFEFPTPPSLTTGNGTFDQTTLSNVTGTTLSGNETTRSTPTGPTGSTSTVTGITGSTSSGGSTPTTTPSGTGSTSGPTSPSTTTSNPPG